MVIGHVTDDRRTWFVEAWEYSAGEGRRLLAAEVPRHMVVDRMHEYVRDVLYGDPETDAQRKARITLRLERAQEAADAETSRAD